MIQERSNLDLDVKCANIQFYGNSHNSRFNLWIALKFYVESPDMSYLGLNFQVNRSTGRNLNTGHQRLANFVIYFLLTCGLSI